MAAIPENSLNAACAAVYRSWLRFLPEPEALEQATQFRRRCENIAAEGHLTEDDLDRTLALVAENLGSPV